MRLHEWLASAQEHPAVAALSRRIHPMAESALFPVLAGALAFGGALSMTLPNVPLICAMVALDRRRWLAISAWMAAGSALAAALVAFLIETWGRDLVAAMLPHLFAAEPWGAVERWMSDWGFLVLAGVTATPLSQTPVIVAAALLGMPAMLVFAAALLGKLIKYSLVAYLMRKTLEAVGEDGR